MKIKNIDIKNFQSVKHISLDINERGVTRFKGPNNIGKSVILKAIKMGMQNESNRNYKEFIRDEEDTLEISITDFDGNWVYLSRGEVDFYSWNINGIEGRMDRTGGKVPKEVKEYLNLYVEEEKTGECLNIRLPGDLLLHVDTTPGDNAMMLQRALGTEDYMLGTKQVDKRERDLKKEIKLVEKYSIQEEEKLQVAQAERHKAETKLEDIERYEDILKGEKEKFDLLVTAEKDSTEYLNMRNSIKESEEMLKDLNIEGLGNDLELIKHMKQTINLEEDYKEDLEDYQQGKKTLEELNFEGVGKEIQDMKEIVYAYDLYVEVEGIEEELSKVSIGSKEEIKETEDEVEKLTLLNETISTVKEINTIKKGIKSQEEDLDQLNKEKEDLEKEMGHCPTCGASFPHEH